MIKLFDFSKCIEFIRLREKMGVNVIPVLPPVEFKRKVITKKEIVEKDLPDQKLEKVLTGESVPASMEEISTSKEGLLTYKGRKVVAYIRDQRSGIDYYHKTSTYRYHLCDCSTLRSMRASGREKRYLVTKRKDGSFEVHDLSWGRAKKLIVKMELCYNCIQELRWRGLYFMPFSISGYFEKHNTSVPKTIRRIETVTKIQTYSPNQGDISREYRKAANYRCQSCNVQCFSDPSLLQLHHVDGDPSNNSHNNLRILCIDCHSKQPLHSQVAHPAKAQHQIERIKTMRAEQGIIDIGLNL